MNAKEFKSLVSVVLLNHGFQKSGKYFVHSTAEVTVVVGLQPSSFANGYYINAGFFINELSHQGMLRDVDGDIRCRITYRKEDKDLDLFDLDLPDPENAVLMEKALKSFVNEFVRSSNSILDLSKLLQERPVLLYQTTLKAKEFLGLIG